MSVDTSYLSRATQINDDDDEQKHSLTFIPSNWPGSWYVREHEKAFL